LEQEILKMNTIESLNVNPFIGQRIGTATILKELARGGMAVVFIAYQQTLKRQIAVKVLPKINLTPQKAELFQTEAEAAAILSHPNIIQIFEVGETDEFLFFTMQLVQGATLSKNLKMAEKHMVPSKRLLPLNRTLQIMMQVLDALDYAHQNDIIHMDVKPDNILVENHSKRPLVSDFGIARVLRGEDYDDQTTGGSPLYMAPEQIIGLSVDARTDIYAAGIMLFQMLVPALPLPDFDSYESLLEQKLLNKAGIFQQEPSELNSALDKDMDKIVRRATAYEPEKRYATCQQFLKDIKWYQRRLL
jgi:serine/threonine-protein kinase